MWWMMVLLAVTNLFVVLCMHFAFRQVGKYKEQRILGVTLSQEQVEDEDVKKIVAEYQKRFRLLILLGYVSGVAIVFLFLGYMSIATIGYLVWMFGYIALLQYLYVKYHKDLYALKKKKGFIYGRPIGEISIDTTLTRLKDTMPISSDWFLPAILVPLLPFCSGRVREYAQAEPRQILYLYGVILFTKAVYYFLYYLFAKQRSVVYSENSELNLACNRITKRGYSILFVCESFVDSIGSLVLVWDMADAGKFSGVSLIVFWVIQSGIVLSLFWGIYQIQSRRKALLKGEKEVVPVDEDEYWASGVYNNPQDKRLFVQDRNYDTNLTLNYGKISAWVWTIGFLGGTFVLLVWMSIVLLRLDFVPVTYQVAENFQIKAPSYGKEIEYGQIKSVKLLDKLPDIPLSKQNGAATDQYALGKFYSRGKGTCYLYIYYDYSPVVELQLDDMTIYFNSKEEGVTEDCYRKLLEKQKEM